MISLNALLVVLISGAVVYGTSLIQKQGEKLMAAKVQTKAVEAQQLSLSQAKNDLEKYLDLNNIARSIVPQDKDQAKTVREINKFAEESGITLKTISFSSSNLGQAAPVAPKPESSTGGQETAQTPAPAAPSISQVTPVEGITNVFAMDIIVSSVEQKPISYESLINFLEKLEKNRRTAHVKQINIKPIENGDGLSFSLTLSAYIKP